MDIFSQGEIVATLEMPDGSMCRGKVSASAINIDHSGAEYETWDGSRKEYISTGVEWSMDLRGIGVPLWISKPEALRQVRAMQTALEWKCEYCASVHPSSVTGCASCGAARSFLYG